MFNPNDGDFTVKTTKTFMWTTTSELTAADKQQLNMVQNALALFGGRLANNVEVTRYAGSQMRQTEKYTASRPANG